MTTPLPHIDTLAVHAGREGVRASGVHALPIDLSTTYPLPVLDAGIDSLDAMVQGLAPTGSPVYARLHNPTVARLEEAMATLEGAEESVAFASGMAAIAACLLTLPADRRHVVALRPLYGGTDHLLSSGLLGHEVTWTTPKCVGDAIRPDTGLVVLETPTNPMLTLVDIAAVVAAVEPIPVLVDSTFAPPVIQRPLLHGAAVSVHSATKSIGGHGDVVAGIVSCDGPRAALLRQVRIATGALLHPLGAYLLHRGLQTLPIRIARAQATAVELVARLSQHRSVETVFFPTVAGCDPDGVFDRQMSGPGSVLSFDVGSREVAVQVMSTVQLITPAVSLGSADTLIEHPASLTHRIVDASVRDSCGISPGLLRLSVGLEAVDDLWEDLRLALPS